MGLVARWGVAVVVSAAGFVLAWWVCEGLADLDEAVSLAIAGAVLAILLAVAAWWAPRGSGSGEASGAGPEQESQGRQKTGNVSNTVSGGIQYGPVVQGRDFTGLTFGATPPPPPAGPGDVDAG